MRRRTHPAVVLLACGALVLANACDSPHPDDPGSNTPSGPNLIMWGLNWCPECRRGPPLETEQTIIHNALVNHVSQNCVEAAIGGTSYWWLVDTVSLGDVWLDLDVINMPEYDYARGYYVPLSLRYQYDGIPLYLSWQHTVEDDGRSIARTLIHEAGHEAGWGDTPEEEEELEWFALLCSY